MTRLETQIQELSPSVKDALFRKLLYADNLAWLRNEKKKNQVIGFEVDLEDQELSGFALVAIQRHTIIAYVSDRGENPRLILFPTLETLFDPGFELLDLVVTRKEFADASFKGRETGHGRFGDMVKDLTPPNRKMDIPETVVEQMAAQMEEEEERPQTSEPIVQKELKAVPKNPEPIPEDIPEEEVPPEEFLDEEDDFEDSGYGSYDEYEDYEDYDNYEDEPAIEPSKSEILASQTFASLSDVVDFVVLKLGVRRDLALTLANKVMQSQVAPKQRPALAVKLFCKLFDEGKI